jgi:MFS family permease
VLQRYGWYFAYVDLNNKEGAMQPINKALIAALATSVPLYFITATLVGLAAAISLPDGYVAWMNESGSRWIGMTLWNILTLYPAMVAPIVAAVVLVCALAKLDWRYYCAALVILYLGYFYINAAYLGMQYPSYWSLNNWHALVPSFVVVGAIYLAGYWYDWVSSRRH